MASFEGFLVGLFMLAIGIAVLVAVARLGDIRDELREQSRLLRGTGSRETPAADGRAERWAPVPGGNGRGIRLDDPAGDSNL